MKALLLNQLRHVLRSRLIVFWFLFSFVAQFFGLKMLSFMIVKINHVVTVMGISQTVALAFLIQLATSGFLTALYASSMVPYLHQEPRVSLSFTWPVSRWCFPLTHCIILAFLLVGQLGMMFLAIGLVFDTSVFSDELFPWTSLLASLPLEFLACEVLMLLMGLIGIRLGRMVVLLLSGTVFFGLFGLRVLVGANEWDFSTLGESAWSWLYFVYVLCPPFGAIYEHLIELYHQPDAIPWSYGWWAIWMAIALGLFRWQLRRPYLRKGAEL